LIRGGVEVELGSSLEVHMHLVAEDDCLQSEYRVGWNRCGCPTVRLQEKRMREVDDRSRKPRIQSTRVFNLTQSCSLSPASFEKYKWPDMIETTAKRNGLRLRMVEEHFQTSKLSGGHNVDLSWTEFIVPVYNCHMFQRELTTRTDNTRYLMWYTRPPPVGAPQQEQ